MGPMDMSLTSAVRSDTLPAVGSMVVPGVVASAPYIALLWGPPHDLKDFVNANQGAATAGAVLLVVAVGLIVESLGSYFEYYAVDAQHENRDEMVREWRRYLRITWKVEPTGQHYVRRILTVFKFELNMFVGALATVPGTIALGCYGVLPPHGALSLLVLAAFAAAGFFVASVHSSVLLAGLRQDLVAVARLTHDLHDTEPREDVR